MADDPLASSPGQNCFAEHCVAFWRHQPVRRSAAFLLRQARKNGGSVHLISRPGYCQTGIDYDGARLLVARGDGRIEACVNAPGHDVFALSGLAR